LHRLLDLIASLLLLLPLLTLTRAGYQRGWWRRCETDLFPFPTHWVARMPLVAWYLALWMIAVFALTYAVLREYIAVLALTAGMVEVGYGLLRAGKPIAPLKANIDTSVVAFALGHNALTEELIFRGPLWLAALALSDGSAWRYGLIVMSALAFGLYHRQFSGPSRWYDTTAFGCVLGAVAIWHGLSSATLVHLVHNGLAIPFGQTDESIFLWRRRRTLYITGLMIVAVARLGLDGLTV
jgi:hypothetical protein